MRQFTIGVLVLLYALLALGCQETRKEKNLILLKAAEDPTISFRLTFKVGSRNDPKGKEGLAALTAMLLSKGATQEHSYEEIMELLYPMAASINTQVDKELTVFYGRVHKDNVKAYYNLFREVMLQPAFEKEDFERVKNDLLNYVKTSLRYSQDEELGKEVLYEFIFEKTPYAHNEEGHIQALNSITLEDVKTFYQTHYNRNRVWIGLGGGFNDALARQIQTDLNILKDGIAPVFKKPQPDPIDGLMVKIVEKDANATAISFGFPINVKRGERDFYALALATSWLGEHRNSFSHLFQVIREKRGLNYGDYAYIEHFPHAYAHIFPPPNVPRQQQIFQIWIRPVPHYAKVFAFRAALRELQDLVENGMSQADFELSKKFLKNYILHYAPTTNKKLGYMVDDKFYNVQGHHWDIFSKTLDELTLTEVNAAIKKHLQYKNIKAAFITSEAEKLRDILINDTPSPIEYESKKPAEILEEDKEIATYPLSVKPENVITVKIDNVFQ